jgi:hypothetical protein
MVSESFPRQGTWREKAPPERGQSLAPIELHAQSAYPAAAAGRKAGRLLARAKAQQPIERASAGMHRGRYRSLFHERMGSNVARFRCERRPGRCSPSPSCHVNHRKRRRGGAQCVRAGSRVPHDEHHFRVIAHRQQGSRTVHKRSPGAADDVSTSLASKTPAHFRCSSGLHGIAISLMMLFIFARGPPPHQSGPDALLLCRQHQSDNRPRPRPPPQAHRMLAQGLSPRRASQAR